MKKYSFNKKLPLLALAVFLGGLVYLLTQTPFVSQAGKSSPAQMVLDCAPKADGESLATVSQEQNSECLFIGCGGFF